MKKYEYDENFPVDYKLTTISHQIRGMAYLIENQRPFDAIDSDDVNMGIGSILTDISKSIYKVAIHLQEQAAAQESEAKNNEPIHKE